MFGYIYPNKPELKVKEFYHFKGYYCGLCKSIKKEFGQKARMFLNYDTTFLAILLSGLYETPGKMTMERCIANPLKKTRIIYNEYITYSAYINVILAYHKLKDNWEDDRSFLNLMGTGVYHFDYKHAKKKYPNIDALVKSSLQKLSKLEKENCSSIDETSNIFGEMLGEIFVYKKDDFSDILRKIGFHTGKLIYILDAYDDLLTDIKSNSYNPLKTRFNENQGTLKEEIKNTLFFILDIISSCIDELQIKYNKSIIENIVFSGVYVKAMNILERRNKKEKMDI